MSHTTIDRGSLKVPSPLRLARRSHDVRNDLGEPDTLELRWIEDLELDLDAEAQVTFDLLLQPA